MMQSNRTGGLVLAVFFSVLLNGVAAAVNEGDPPAIEVVGPAPPRDPERPLRIATANLWGVSVLGFDWADAIDERFAEFARRLAENEPDLDVLLVQEAWKDSARRALLEHEGVSERFPFRIDVVERPGGAGLVVLSRIPIETARFQRFEAQGNCLRFWEGDCLGRKGILLVGLRLGERRIWIADTHLIACYAADDAPGEACDADDPNGETRWEQLREIRSFLAAEVGDDPVLVGGDFNFTRSSRYYAALRGDPERWSEPGDGTTAPGRVDYLWSRRGQILEWRAVGPALEIFAEPVELRSGERRPVSDHAILAADFCLVRIDDTGSDDCS